MTPIEQQILDLLERMPTIDNITWDESRFMECLRWMTEGMEIALRHQLELREELRIRLGSVSPPDEPWWDSTRPPDKP